MYFWRGFQIRFSSYVKLNSSNNLWSQQFSQRQANLKIHLLSKTIFDWTILKHIRTIPLLAQIWSKYKVHFHLLNVSFIIKFLALLNKQFFFVVVQIIGDITITSMNIRWLFIFESKQLWLVHFNLTLTGAEIFSTACNN